MKTPKLTSTFALLDVKNGHKWLFNRFKKRPTLGPCPPKMRVPVTITGYIDDVWGDFDGTSREFSVTVTSVEVHGLNKKEDEIPL